AEALALGYVASWAYYDRTGQFASYEGLVYLAACPPGAEERFAAIFFRELARALLVGSPIFLGLPFCLRWLGRAPATPSGLDAATLARKRRYMWYGFGFAVGIGIIVVKTDDRDTRVWLRLDALQRRTNPLIALGFTWAETLGDQRVAPDLDERELVPRATPWQAGSISSAATTIVLVKLESGRADTLGRRVDGRPVMPTLEALASEGLDFTRAYAQATHTDDSESSLHASQYPVRTRRHSVFRESDPWP